MAAVYYPISKPSSGELITSAKFNEITNAVISEASRRGQSASFGGANSSQVINSAYANAIFYYINQWIGSGYAVAAGAPVTPTHIHWMIDGLNAAGSNPLVVSFPTTGSISAYFSFDYSYGRPSVVSWSRSGGTLYWNVTSYTTYCGSPKSGGGAAAINQTTSGGVPVETASWVFAHSKDCCGGNQNFMWEYYTLTMNSSGGASLTAYSTAGGQGGC